MLDVCADCTARYGTRKLWREDTCAHDSSAVLRPLFRSDLDVPAESVDRSPWMSFAELAQLHVQGRDLYRRLTDREPWAATVPVATIVDALRVPWGGMTMSRDRGRVDFTTGYAVTIRPAGVDPVRVGFNDGNVSLVRPNAAILARTIRVRSPYIGVFRDDEAGFIDVDPVAVVATLREAQALGVFCRSTGGAYNFADGLGYWTPTL